MNPSNLLRRHFYPLLGRVAIEKQRRDGGRITLHSLRHTSATLMLEAGIDVKVVSHVLGHSDTRITQHLYQHVGATLEDQAAVAVDATLAASDTQRTAR